ncbi:MAG: holo-ACP synthase [Eggerthellaceae bacterium]|nr:holo-ACP synthase [Eggerthellaceae bacterium]
MAAQSAAEAQDSAEDAPDQSTASVEDGAGQNAASVDATPDQSAASADEVEADLPVPELEGSVGLGVDLVKIERMKRILKRTPRFSVRVYTAEERNYCEGTAQPHVHYATRFAAKEAVLKALGTGFAFGIAPADVEVLRNQYGRPIVQLHRKAAEIASKQGVREIPISLSYTHDEAVACAMAITADSVRVAEERIDPMEELAKQFKEARSLLDDLPTQHEDGTREGTLPEMPEVDVEANSDASVEAAAEANSDASVEVDQEANPEGESGAHAEDGA